MKHVKILSALGLLAMAGAANADVTANFSAVSQYDWRGAMQTLGTSAIQGGFDYAHDSGWYVGTWASTVPGTNEVDLYTGFAGSAGSLGWDVGVIQYAYPKASEYNTNELYGKLTAGPVVFGLYYSPDFFDTDESAQYVSADLTLPLGSSPFSLAAHAGYSAGDGVEAYYGIDSGYIDSSVGLNYAAENFTLGMKYVGATKLHDVGAGTDSVVFSVGTKFPWSK